MNRRELLKSGMAMTVNGTTIWRAFAIESSTKYIVFCKPGLMGPKFSDQFIADHPGSTVYPVDGNIDEAIRIFEAK